MPERDRSEGGFILQTTRAVRRQDRFDYWRSLHPSVHLDLPDGHGCRQFEGQRLYYRAESGCVVGYADAEDAHANFDGADPSFLLLSCVLAGATEFRSRKGAEVTAKPGAGILLVDSAAKISSRSHECAHTYITLPKHLLGDAFDQTTLTGKDGLCLLPETGLLRFLQLQLQEIAAIGRGLSADATTVAVDALVQLAIGAMSEGRLQSFAEPTDKALFEAAMAMIRVHASRLDLTSASIAKALGCSRAHLYGAFTARGVGVGQMIREARNRRARSLLAERPSAPIKVVARMSGYQDAASFTRAFRLQTGFTPTEYRETLRRKLG